MNEDLQIAISEFKRGYFDQIQIVPNFPCSPKQVEALKYLTDDTTYELGYGGGARGGKSILGCTWIFLSCLAYPETRWAICRKELTNLRATTIQTLYKVFDRWGFTDYREDGKDHFIELGNKSRIIFRDTAYKPTDREYAKLGGLEITGAFIDESNESPLKAVNMVNSRVNNWNNDKYGIVGKVLETFNPDKGHVYNRYYHAHKNKYLPITRKFIKALASDNPSQQAKDYVIRLLATGTKSDIARLVHGDFEYDEGDDVLYESDAIRDTLTNTFIKTGDRYVTADIAREGDDKTFIAYWNGWRCEDWEFLAKASINDNVSAINKMRNKYNVPSSHTIVDASGVGSGEADLLYAVRFKAGFKATTKEFPNLRAQAAYKLAEMINAGLVYVNDKGDHDFANRFIRELEVTRRAKLSDINKKWIVSKDKQKEGLQGKSPDIFDALIMRTMPQLNIQKDYFAAPRIEDQDITGKNFIVMNIKDEYNYYAIQVVITPNRLYLQSSNVSKSPLEFAEWINTNEGELILYRPKQTKENRGEKRSERKNLEQLLTKGIKQSSMVNERKANEAKHQINKMCGEGTWQLAISPSNKEFLIDFTRCKEKPDGGKDGGPFSDCLIGLFVNLFES